MIRIGVLASGRGSNFIAIDDAAKNRFIDAEISVLICNNTDAAVIESARKRGVNVVVEPSKGISRDAYDQRLARILTGYGVELVLLAGFMRIVGKPLLDAFPMRIMNIHPSLLPAFRGLGAQKQALDYGVKLAGCTVHFVDEGLDSGPIILQAAVPVLNGDTTETLSARILAEEHRIYPEAVKLFTEGKLIIEGRKVFCKD